MSAVSDTPAPPSTASTGGEPDGGPVDQERRVGLREQFRAWPRAGRWAMYVVTGVVLVVVIALVAAVALVRSSFPETEGEIAVPGLTGDVEVLRDQYGVPQIYADTPHDLFYAQGYVQAQDRFYEMDVRRHITAGRLSEMLGESALDTDKFIRTMGWHEVAEKELSLLDPETLAYLEAFSDGVNAYIDTHRPSSMSLEYAVLALNGLDYAPEEWEPVDSVAWLKAMAWDLRSNMEDEITRAVLAGRYSEDDIAGLFPPYPYGRHQPIVGQGAVVDGVDDTCPFDVTGFTFSGLPGVIIGHNRDIAWGFTNLGPDVTDLYLEKIEGQRYEYDGELHDLKLRDETIEVLGREEPFTFTVRSTRHGPLLSDVSAELSTVGANSPVEEGAPERGNGYGVALSWTALQPANTADAIFELNAASDWDEFRAAAADFAAPSQNIVYADREGHIGYQAPGLIPIRKSGNDGDYPAEGWLPANDWTGKYVPFDALPTVLDPDAGYVATANQAVVGRDYPFHLTGDWAYGYRSQRIVEMLEQKEKLSVGDMAQMQLDEKHGFAPTMVPYLLDVLMPSDYLGAGQRLLKSWDYDDDADSAAAAYFNAVWKETLRLTFHDDMREAVWPEGDGRWFEVMRRLLEDPDSHWWDDANTETTIETRDDILAAALAAARDDLVVRQSRRAVDWTWGHHHRLNLENQTLGQSDIGLVQWLFNRGGWQVGGGSEIVNATSWNAATDTYEVTAAPSMRMVVSMADFDDSRWVSLTGTSGHAFHDNYVDQTELWAEGRTLPWLWSRDALEESAEHRLVLKPGE